MYTLSFRIFLVGTRRFNNIEVKKKTVYDEVDAGLYTLACTISRKMSVSIKDCFQRNHLSFQRLSSPSPSPPFWQRLDGAA